VKFTPNIMEVRFLLKATIIN